MVEADCARGNGKVGKSECTVISEYGKAEMKTCKKGKGECTKDDIEDGKKYVKSCRQKDLPKAKAA